MEKKNRDVFFSKTECQVRGLVSSLLPEAPTQLQVLKSPGELVGGVLTTGEVHSGSLSCVILVRDRLEIRRPL